jgi:hypothetical protein
MIKIDKFSDRNVLKYTTNYFVENYILTDNLVIRKKTSDIESQNDKPICLLKCFDYFTKSNTVDYINSFECVEESVKVSIIDFQTRCCCSQNEELGLNYEAIKHKDTGIIFVIGKVCFKNLFGEECGKKELKYFFQPTCKECGEKVKKNNRKTSGFCKTSCFKKFNDRELNLIKQEEKKKFPYGKNYNCRRCDVKQKNIKYIYCRDCV